MRIRHDTLKKPLKQLKQMGLDRTSLQLRLTLGITTIALLGVGGIGTWTTWQMRQMLIVDHKKDINAVTTHLERQLSESSPDQWQTAVDEWTAPELWVAAKPMNGDLMARSGTLVKFSEEMSNVVWSQVPTEPTVQTLDGRHLVLDRQKLERSGQSIGELYLARDITHDYNVLSTLINTLRFATLLALATIATLMSMYIRRSLHPLRRMNQMAVIQAGKTQRAPLLPAHTAPTEVQGFIQAMSTLSNRLFETGERQRQFTNSLSHELRTSLCLIQGYLHSTLRRGSNLTAHQQEALEIAASETDRTIQLLKDLLDLGRINSGAMELYLKPVVVNDLVDGIIERVDPVRERTIDLKAESLVVAEADVDQLNRVLLHLLKNAKQYSQPSQAIQLHLRQTPDWAIIQVTDRGCGIAEADQPRIFEPFYRVEASRCRATGGMGLGLAIVKSLVEAMGGEIEMQSMLGTGSTFTVKLPAAK